MTPSGNASVDSAAALKCALAGEVLRSFGTLRFTATGWSMLPAVWPGDTLLVERIRADQVRVDDIVLVGRAGRLCAHRVIAASGGAESRQWITQGDGMADPDPPVAESELLGRVTYLIRAGRLLKAPARLSLVGRAVARVVQRSASAARVAVHLQQIYLHHQRQASPEPIIPCPS
ncbi:MAG: S24/S26 family peptidase [Candidatus Sulfotelmatobacter sp.]